MNQTVIKLLYGPYVPPALPVGERTTCLYRDCEVVVTSWTDAPISWPRCRALHSSGGGSGLLVNEELLRAIRTESAEAIKHWWGVSSHAVWRWRRAFDVEPMNEGSTRLRHALNAALGRQLRGKRLTRQDGQPTEAEVRDLGHQRLRGQEPPTWTPKEDALIRKLPAGKAAEKLGRSLQAVYQRRHLLRKLAARS